MRSTNMKTTEPGRPQEETRTRLIQAAGEVFAEVGYDAATTRQICARAGTNVAAVNYHFGDKLGLYTEVLKSALLKPDMAPVEAALAAKKPEEALRLFLLGRVRKMGEGDRPAWYVKVMTHELAQPTPGLAVVVETLIRPNAKVLCEIVSRIIDRPPLHPQTRMCAHSIVGQVVHYVHARPVISLLWPEWKMTPEALDEIAHHVTDFSLAALKGIRKQSAPVAARRTRLK
jgi:TetR/AcrR family transcriptional regulator, regulator of cefoperazone and chloramphenicol sensitivity